MSDLEQRSRTPWPILLALGFAVLLLPGELLAHGVAAGDKGYILTSDACRISTSPRSQPTLSAASSMRTGTRPRFAEGGHPTRIPVHAGASLAGKLSSEASSTLSSGGVRWSPVRRTAGSRATLAGSTRSDSSCFAPEMEEAS